MKNTIARSFVNAAESVQMQTPTPASIVGRTVTDADWIDPRNIPAEDPAMPLVMFLKSKFIPDHVELKSAAGRTHYHAILKYILRPETVDALFAPYIEKSKGRLKAADGWPYLDDIRLCDLNANHVRELTSSATAYGYSPQTVKHIKNVVSKIISHAQKERIFAGDNPMRSVELPPMQRKKPHTLTMAQTKEIIRMLEHPEREIALLTITTGMSLFEIFALQWKNVNLTNVPIRTEGTAISPHSVVIKKQWHMNGIANVQITRERELPLPKPLIDALSRLKWSIRTSAPDGFVFSTGEGNPIRPADLHNRQVKRIGRELDIPWLSWKVLGRAHEALLCNLRIKIASELASNA